MKSFSKLKEIKILLIDDDEWIRDSLGLFFQEKGCHLLAFETAEKGMEELKKQAFDIIIADYKLPGMDGLEFFKKIQEFYPDSIKILITAYANNELASKTTRIGIDIFIEKPLTISSIEECLSWPIKKRFGLV